MFICDKAVVPMTWWLNIETFQVFIPDARKLPESVLSVSLIHKKRWINPDKIQKYDFYGTLQREVEDKETFDYLYEEAKSNGKRPREESE